MKFRHDQLYHFYNSMSPMPIFTKFEQLTFDHQTKTVCGQITAATDSDVTTKLIGNVTKLRITSNYALSGVV